MSGLNGINGFFKGQKTLPIFLSALLILSPFLKANAQDGQQQISPQVQETKLPQTGVSGTGPENQSSQAFRLSATQAQTLPAQATPVLPPQLTNPYYPGPGQAPYARPAQPQFVPAQPQFGIRSNNPQFRTQSPLPPTRIFSAAAVTHSGPGLMSDSSPLAYDLTICQDDANFHPPYLVPAPEILNTGSAFGESAQNVHQWQLWADHVAMAAWTAWRQHALPEFGCAEIDIKLNRDGSFQAKRGNFRYRGSGMNIPVEQAPFLLQLDPFLRYLQNTRVFRIPDSIRMNASQPIEFQIQVGVRQKDRANPYSWCGFMNDWKWWTGTGLQVYHRIECELNGLGK